jgi:hypothetical protein
MSTWEPIETAPKDCTDVLLYSPYYRAKVGFWDVVGWVAAGGYPDLDDATHWMALPEPPAT